MHTLSLLRYVFLFLLAILVGLMFFRSRTDA